MGRSLILFKTQHCLGPVSCCPREEGGQPTQPYFEPGQTLLLGHQGGHTKVWDCRSQTCHWAGSGFPYGRVDSSFEQRVSGFLSIAASGPCAIPSPHLGILKELGLKCHLQLTPVQKLPEGLCWPGVWLFLSLGGDGTQYPIHRSSPSSNRRKPVRTWLVFSG